MQPHRAGRLPLCKRAPPRRSVTPLSTLESEALSSKKFRKPFHKLARFADGHPASIPSFGPLQDAAPAGHRTCTSAPVSAQGRFAARPLSNSSRSARGKTSSRPPRVALMILTPFTFPHAAACRNALFIDSIMAGFTPSPFLR